MFKTLKNKVSGALNAVKGKIAVGASAMVASASSMANEDITTAITGAVSSGQGNYTLVVVGVIGLAAIGFGLSAIVGAMRR